ncbi:hypothetical protein C8Q76DRAFT_793710 [Earliella scabrosa]|nr:hypothetical protein C8Q76DRAFT_793710 [Earliella scabrosa]
MARGHANANGSHDSPSECTAAKIRACLRILDVRVGDEMCSIVLALFRRRLRTHSGSSPPVRARPGWDGSRTANRSRPWVGPVSGPRAAYASSWLCPEYLPPARHSPSVRRSYFPKIEDLGRRVRPNSLMPLTSGGMPRSGGRMDDDHLPSPERARASTRDERRV